MVLLGDDYLRIEAYLENKIYLLGYVLLLFMLFVRVTILTH